MPFHYPVQPGHTILALEDGTPQPVIAVAASTGIARGQSVNINVSLPAAPSGNTTVRVVTQWGSSGQVNVSPATLTFTSGNFATPQAVTVTYSTGSAAASGHVIVRLVPVGPDVPGYSPATVTIDLVGG